MEKMSDERKFTWMLIIQLVCFLLFSWTGIYLVGAAGGLLNMSYLGALFYFVIAYCAISIFWAIELMFKPRILKGGK